MPLYARSSIAHNRVNEDEQNKAKRIEIAKSLAEKIIALEYSGPKTAARALEAVEARVSYQQIARQLTKLREESGKRPRTVEAREELKEAESIALEAATAEEEAGEEGAAGGGKRARTVEVPVYSHREAGTGTLLPGAKQFQVVAIDAKTRAEQVLTRQFDMERAEWTVERAALEAQVCFLTKKNKELTEKVESLTKKNLELKPVAAHAKAAEAKLRSQNSLSDRWKDERHERVRLERELDALETEFKEFKVEVEEAKMVAEKNWQESLEKERGLKKASLQRARDAKRENEGLRASLSNCATLQRRIDELESEKSVLKLEVSELNSQLSEERRDHAQEKDTERKRYNDEMTSARAEVTRLNKIIEQLKPDADRWRGIRTCNPVSNGRPGHKSIPDETMPGLLMLVQCNAMIPALREAWRAVLMILFHTEGLPSGKFGYIPGETHLRDLRRYVLPTVSRSLSAVAIYSCDEVVCLQTDGGQVQANKNSGSVISTKLELRPHDSDDRSAAGTDIVTLGSVQATNGTKGTDQEGTSRCA